MSNYERRVGDICVDSYGQVVLLQEIDHTEFRTLKTYDVGISLRPKVGYQVHVQYSRPVISVEELLQIAEEKGVDLKTLPERPASELSDIEKLRRDNEKLAQRLAALEQKSQ
jgi:hypothetical protein